MSTTKYDNSIYSNPHSSLMSNAAATRSNSNSTAATSLSNIGRNSIPSQAQQPQMLSPHPAPSSMKTIVIIGAGFYGISAANRLAKLSNRNYSVKLITLSNYTVLLPAAARAAIQNRLENIVIPLRNVLDPRVETIVDEVINFNEDEVQLMRNGGSALKFDSLIIATGARWSDPIGTTSTYKDKVGDYFSSQAEKFAKAKDIVLIGGGYFSVELAGELIHAYQKEFASGEKTLTLIHSGDKLLAKRGKYTEKFRDKVTDYFRKRTNIKLILNSRGESILKDDGSKLVVVNGRDLIKADLVVFGCGVTPSIPPTELHSRITNDQGFIKVDETFQISSIHNSHIFAIGDVTDFEYKGLLTISEWQDVLIYNVDKILETNRKINYSSLKKAKKTIGIKQSIISLGPKNGIGQLILPILGPIFVPKWVSVISKCKDLYVSNTNELYNA